MNGYAMLRALPDRCARLAFFDPQYRSNLDAMKYGNEGAGREKKRAALPPMSERTIALFVEQLERTLKPSGYAVMWIDKFILGEGRQRDFLVYAPNLSIVDIGHWNKLRPGMGRRLRCYSEYALILQKSPIRAKGTWNDHRIPDTWPEQSDRSLHAHSKPHQLIERIIRSTTKRGDLVLDPCAGSYGVLEACKLSGRDFIGCDLLPAA